MKFEFNNQSWPSLEEGEKNCYLMANGLGGYNSMNLLGGLTRGDQAFFMAAKKAPNVRWNMITGLLEIVTVDGTEYMLTSQRRKGKPDLEGFRYLKSFRFDNYPEWVFEADGVSIKKTIVMVHGENTVTVQYDISRQPGKTVNFSVRPMLRITAKNTPFEAGNAEHIVFEKEKAGQYRICAGENCIYAAASGMVTELSAEVFGPLYFSQDERDGREETGLVLLNHEITLAAEKENQKLTCVFSLQPVAYHDTCFEEQWNAHKAYVTQLKEASRAVSELGRQLAVSADAYVSERESTGGKTILAGFPFFEDWGRDTMIALPGITMVTGRFQECKSILCTFAKYVHKGLLPNLFPEGDCDPMYNSVDAPLLFINTAYEYVQFSGDEEFIEEIYPVLEPILEAYIQGTDFHIKMEEDGLIRAGAGLEQLTWMDVRVGEYLPTPRHGKPVEINAYWYSALKVMEYFAKKLGKAEDDRARYANLAEKVRTAFLNKFWNEGENCLKDVLSGNAEENQVRCNQIWVLTQPFRMLDAEKERQVLKKVKEELYTTIGLRTLSPKDPAFHEIYIGPMQQRDRAYHQGTTWAFPLGAYYRACIRFLREQDFPEKEEWKQHVSEGIQQLYYWLEEGCIAQIAEIYDGGTPTVSRGCYAQAWSVGELLRAVYDYEKWQEA